MTQKVQAKDIINVLESFAPKSLAFEGDPIGLQVGDLNSSVEKVMISLDVLENVVDEAIEQNVDLIIAHHPFIFKPLKSINTNDEKGKIINKLVKHDITVYAAHTNLDIAQGGVNDWLMEQLGLQPEGVVVPTTQDTLYKMVVFVPTSHEDELRNALAEAGAGHIGQYSHCTFNSEGFGTFKPQEGTNPYIGSANELEKVQELRMETVVPASILQDVIDQANEAHPYEEMAYDVYPLELDGEPLGLGRMATLNETTTLEQFAQTVKKAFNVPQLRFVGRSNKKVKKVAVIGGDGNKFIHQAKRQGADVLITGDVYYHTAHDALGMGLGMIDPGHHVEEVMKEGLKNELVSRTESRGYDVAFVSSNQVTEPFQFLGD
ncbi:Nif3-like dinuclear metal center hexameric protein [Alkalibacillus almallahensis]|uniref:Nif3-like dinuclear metal center hexameric protein n=1 Tax=Alkalibacillus almallahensis TaxID=1379154 RepID=UPI00141E10B4|nr:Nif3-like dinuclear metal center hexameric protein [Alkalibacillus almallahensis]NIK13366.1 dinuclear metal center YbgI/SA1388 family protein [Alkalibacillus almallahensis]